MAPVDAPTLAALTPSALVRSVWRHVAPRHDPLSGEGARIHGGRFNPPESFPVLYFCLTRECAVAEFNRMATRQAIGPEGFLPRRLYRYDIDLTRVLDLCDATIREALDIELAELIDEDRSVKHEIGVIAHGLSFQAICSPSATGVDDVLAIFPENLGGGILQSELAEEWTSLEQLAR